MITHPLKETHAFFTLIVLIIAVILFPTVSLADANKIFKENNKAVVVVVTFDSKGNPISQGSGFIVRADGAIVTNYHVISNAVDIKVKAGDKVLDVEGLIHTDKENDLVILKAKGKNLLTVKLGDIGKTNIGEKVYVISSPQGLENTISDGILSGIRDIDSKRKILQITAPVSKGSSGGPVFNKNGEVIGVAAFIIEEAQNVNFAMPVNLIKNKISSEKITALKDSAIEDYKKTAVYWFALGYTLFETGLYKEAIEAFRQGIRLKPDFAAAHLGLGFAYDELGMYKEAIEAFKQVIRIIPNYAAYYSLGIAYNRLGMYKEAIEAYKHAIKLKLDSAEAHLGLGNNYYKLGMHKEAVEAYKQAIRIKPDEAKVHYNLGVVYGKDLGMNREAIEAYKQAIRIKPDFAEVHYNLGLAYLILSNDRGSALEQYKILKDLDTELANKLFNSIYE